MIFAFFRMAAYAVFFSTFPALLGAQTVPAVIVPTKSIWTDVPEQTILTHLASTRGAAIRRDIVPRKYRTLQIDKSALKTLLASAVSETAGSLETAGIEFVIPHP